jgi:hypothetical protein
LLTVGQLPHRTLFLALGMTSTPLPSGQHPNFLHFVNYNVNQYHFKAAPMPLPVDAPLSWAIKI